MLVPVMNSAVARGNGPALGVPTNKREHGCPPASTIALQSFKLAWLLSMLAATACANVCTPLTAPANGPFAAVVNGIDALDWGIARVQWTSDATASVPSTQQRIQYATAAQWASNPGTYPQTHAIGYVPAITNSIVIQGDILPNLKPSTTYHVMGQSLQGGSWCSGTDVTFTTLARPAGTTLPQQPQTFSTTRPSITGTDWIYGSTCGTGSSVASNMQDCFGKAQPGDGIGIPPGTYKSSPFYIPHNPNAVQITCTTTGSTCSPVSGSAPANGTKIRMGAFQANIPSPINPGVTYTVLNSTGTTFQVSYDGTNPLTLINSGSGNIFYAVWPLTQGYVVVHSTATASLLPPDGVRLGPDSLAAYLPQMPNIQSTEFGQPTFLWTELSSYYWFQNIAFSVDPTATVNCGNCVDPVGFKVIWGTATSNDHIIWNQCAFVAPPPNRTQYLQIDGSNIGFLNSYIFGLDFWQPFRAIPAATISSNTLTYGSGFFSWVGQNGVKQSCNYSGGSLTLAGTGSFLTYIDPASCALDAQIQTGMTATSSNVTVSTVATPAFPTYTYTSPGNASYTGLNVLTVGTGSISSGAISYSDLYGISPQASESGQGLATGNGPGPLMVVNNYISGGGVVGVFLTDGGTNGTSPCGYFNPCAAQYNMGNITEQRNTITTGPTKDYNSPSWNGGNYFWRNLSEVKQGKWVKQDGNIYGPIWAQVADGECVSHGTYSGGFPTYTGILNYTDSSEWTFTNNTCYQAAQGVFQGFSYYNSGIQMPFHNAYIHNNLFNQVYGYQESFPLTRPLGNGRAQTQTSTSCVGGKLLQWGQDGENFIFDHNTVWQMGGCQPWFWNQYGTLSSGMAMTNNILALTIDSQGPYSGGTLNGTYFQSYSVVGSGAADVPDCGGFQGSALFACMNNFTWGGNAVVGFWSDSFPGSLVDMTNAQISAAAAQLPTSYYPSAGTALADRLNQVAWFNPMLNNFRLKSASPYISGAKASMDGLDIGVDMDQLEAAQGKVSNVHAYGTTSTSTKIGLLAPDAFGCTVDWGTSNFPSGSGTFTRVTNAGGQRVQNVALAGLPAHSLIYYRLNCAVQQPQGTVQLP